MKKVSALLPLLACFFISQCSNSTDSTPVHTFSSTTSPPEAGSVEPSSGEYEAGDEVELTASPNEDWLFDQWQGDASGTENPVSILISDDTEVTALFVKKEYPLTVNTDGMGTVTEQIIQQKSTDYEQGTLVLLTASPSDGWEFIEWQGDVTGTGYSVQISVDQAREVTAVFGKQSFELTLDSYGEGSVTRDPDQSEYEYNDVVELTAGADADWEFVHWEGDLASSENPVTIAIDSAMTISAVFANPSFAGGTGIQADPYQVSTAAQLQAIDDFTDAYFLQANDIDASETAGWNGGAGFDPIGDISGPFTGTYDGGGYEISALTIDRREESYIGLFGVVDGEASINKAGLTDINVRGDNEVGGLVGINYGEVFNSYVTGHVIGNALVGGLAGQATGGFITQSFATADVDGSSEYIGGLTGSNQAEIKDSYALGKVSSNSFAGGLTGENFGTITTSYAGGQVTGDAGGFAGMNFGSINGSYWDTEATNQSDGVAHGVEDGLTGRTTNQMQRVLTSITMSDFDWDAVWLEINGYPILQWQDE